MTNEERLADLLLMWQERADGGHDVPAVELCRESPALAHELQRRIDVLKKMKWVDDISSEAGTSAVSSLARGNEPIPGFKLVRRIGRGGYGEVWEADCPSGKVALKFVSLAEKGASVEKRALAAVEGLTHPHLLPTWRSWQIPGYLVIAMELAERTIWERLLEAKSEGHRGIPSAELRRYMVGAADALDFLHSKGIQHRDVKPQNLLLIGGALKVGDFGLVRVLMQSLTSHTGNLTVAFAAPEFFDGKTSKSSDQYCLAATYCQLKGGRLPFEGTSAQMVEGHLHKEPDLSMLPEEERSIVARALSKDPKSRWPSCKAFVDALDASLRTALIPQRKRRSWQLIPFAAVIVAAVVIPLALRKDEQPSTPIAHVPSTAEMVKPKEELTPPVPITHAPSPAKPVEPQGAFVFNGKARIITPVDRFAPVTLEAWVWPDSPKSGVTERYIIGSDIPSKSGISLAVFFRKFDEAPALGVQLLPIRGRVLETMLPLRQWSHIAAVFGKTQTVVFLNGKEAGKADPTPSFGGTPFVVGNAGKTNPDHYFVGKMRTVRISRGARYSSEFIPEKQFVPDDSAIVIYEPSKVEGAKVLDLSGKGNHGTATAVIVRERDE